MFKEWYNLLMLNRSSKATIMITLKVDLEEPFGYSFVKIANVLCILWLEDMMMNYLMMKQALMSCY